MIVHQNQPTRKAGAENPRPEPTERESLHPYPPSIRFGTRDPRIWEFISLVNWIDEDGPPWLVNEAIARLAKLGYVVTLTRESEQLPELPILTREDKAALARGEKFPWQDPHHIAGGDE